MKETVSQNYGEYPFTEWVLYDGHCSLCADCARRHIGLLNHKGFGVVPIQSDFARQRIRGIDDPLKEMLLLTADGNILSGADALVYLSRRIWWAYGFYLLAQVPGMRALCRRIYAHIARNRNCIRFDQRSSSNV